MAPLLHFAGLAVLIDDRKATWTGFGHLRCCSASLITPRKVHELSSQNPHGRREATLMESRRPILSEPSRFLPQASTSRTKTPARDATSGRVRGGFFLVLSGI